MILVIDTSSALSALALLEPSGKVLREATYPSGRSFDLPARFRDLAGKEGLTAVAVATGPGSFTGLRVGVSFGLGLAIGLRIPILPLPTLGIQAARSDEPVLAVAEAGRGRVYYLAAGKSGLAGPGDLPQNLAVVGWLRPATEAALGAAGLRFKPDSELRSFGAAASRMIGSASEVAYGSLRLEYMQSFSATQK
jgi:tRNA A37 threonylcarbamoyladenosine modification protein TsaB